jgi:hypothetical protein
MLADPIAVTADSPNPALNFAVIRSDGYGAERRDSGGTYGLIINHSTSKNGDRHYVKVTQTIDATNPYTTLVSPQSASVSVSLSKPAFGFTDADMANLYKLIVDTIASSDAGIDNIVAFQS